MASNGTLPMGWHPRRLDEVADIRFSSVDKKSVPGQRPVKLCNYMDVWKNPYIHAGLDFMESTASDSDFRNFSLQVGDVLITKDSETKYDRPAEVEYTVPVKTKTPKVQRLDAFRTEEDLGRLGDIIETVDRAVQDYVFYPVESPLNCSTCPFLRPCLEWGRPQREREKPPILEGSIIGAV